MQSTIERVLSIREVFLDILELFDPATKEGRRTLVSAAQTCRAWKDPALTVIWRVASSRDLVRLMPINRPLSQHGANPYEWAKCLNFEHYKRLLRYAPYIIELEHDDRIPGSDINALWVEAFMTGPASPVHDPDRQPIFPKLSHIQWWRNVPPITETEKKNLPSSGPGSALNIAPNRALSFIKSIVSPRVSSLHLDFHVSPSIGQLTKLINGLPNLEQLTIPMVLAPWTANLFNAISKLKHLKSFSNITQCFEEEDATLYHEFIPSLEKGSFPFLDTLKLNCHPAVVNRLLNLRNSPPFLARLAVRIPYTTPSKDLYFLSDTIADRCYSSIRRVRFECNEATSPFHPKLEHAGEDIALQWFSSLFRIGHLQSFEISCMRDIVYSRSLLQELACAWPKLRCLRLESNPMLVPDRRIKGWPGAEYGLTLDTLFPLVQQCPELRILSLSLSCNLGDLGRSWKPPLPRFRQLQQLTLLPGQIPIRSPQDIALLLYRMLPTDCDVRCKFPVDYGTYETYFRTQHHTRQRELMDLEANSAESWGHVRRSCVMLQDAREELLQELSAEETWYREPQETSCQCPQVEHIETGSLTFRLLDHLKNLIFRPLW